MAVPVLTLISPLSGVMITGNRITFSAIAASTPVVLQVTDDGALVLVQVHTSFAGDPRPPEVVHNGGAFTSAYLGGTNQRVNISGGFEYTLLRDGGWPRPPQIFIYAVDAFGGVL